MAQSCGTLLVVESRDPVQAGMVAGVGLLAGMAGAVIAERTRR